MKLVLRPAAVADVRAAQDFYEEVRPGLGDEFVDYLDRLFARLEAFPRSGQPVAGHELVRRAPLRRFPFAVFYRLTESESIDVLHVVHTARRPAAWRNSAT